MSEYIYNFLRRTNPETEGLVPHIGLINTIMLSSFAQMRAFSSIAYVATGSSTVIAPVATKISLAAEHFTCNIKTKWIQFYVDPKLTKSNNKRRHYCTLRYLHVPLQQVRWHTAVIQWSSAVTWQWTEQVAIKTGFADWTSNHNNSKAGKLYKISFV